MAKLFLGRDLSDGAQSARQGSTGSHAGSSLVGRVSPNSYGSRDGSTGSDEAGSDSQNVSHSRRREKTKTHQDPHAPTAPAKSSSKKAVPVPKPGVIDFSKRPKISFNGVDHVIDSSERLERFMFDSYIPGKKGGIGGKIVLNGEFRTIDDTNPELRDAFLAASARKDRERSLGTRAETQAATFLSGDAAAAAARRRNARMKETE